VAGIVNVDVEASRGDTCQMTIQVVDVATYGGDTWQGDSAYGIMTWIG
jgi:hypothetical protein